MIAINRIFETLEELENKMRVEAAQQADAAEANEMEVDHTNAVSAARAVSAQSELTDNAMKNLNANDDVNMISTHIDASSVEV